MKSTIILFPYICRRKYNFYINTSLKEKKKERIRVKAGVKW